MRRRATRWIAIATALWLTACSGVPERPATDRAAPAGAAGVAAPPVPLLLVSLDGTAARYLERGVTPTLQRFARRGVRAEAMRPSYPSMTFPNHYTLVTGLRPDHHGIVENSMRDAALGTFAMHDRAAVGDGRWWGGEPLWVTLKRAGGHAASMFWPGSEAEIGGVRPDAWQAFSYDVTPETRVDTVLGWLRMPAPTRPRFMTLYFEHVDRAGHSFGPESTQVAQALRRVDAALARLLDGMQAQGTPANVVIVSDHGMSEVTADRVVLLDDLVSLDEVEVWDTGATAQLAPRPGREAAVEAALLGRHGALRCWRKAEMPAQWHYGTHPRIAPIVCLCDRGWYAITRAQLPQYRGVAKAGAHGYDPFEPEMAAIFLAQGPAFARGKVLPAFDNVHVYPLLARLAGVAPAPNDGDPAVLQDALAEPPK
jgi:predicted AlkP superfamily pyrophosphatase or phosphodiesterase